MKVLFDRLPQPVRERFVRIVTTKGDPGLVLQSSFGQMRWLSPVMIVLGAGAMIWALSFILERSETVMAHSDSEVYLGFAVATFVFLAATVGVVYRFIWKLPPYPDGTFLLATYAVRTSGGELELLPLDQLGRPTIVNVYRNGVYSGSRLELRNSANPGDRSPFTFFLSTTAQAEDAASRLSQHASRFARAVATQDAQLLSQIDPFFECTVYGQWNVPAQGPLAGPTAPYVPVAARIARWAGALVIAVAGTFVFYTAMEESCRERNCNAYRGQPYGGAYRSGSYPYGTGR